MTIDEVIDILDDMLDKAWAFPLSGGKCLLDAERVSELLSDIRLCLPAEIKQAKAIVSDRVDIISDAKKEAESIVRKAESRAKQLICEEEIYKNAKDSANEMVSQASQRGRELKLASSEFAENMLRITEEALLENISEIKRARAALKKPKS